MQHLGQSADQLIYFGSGDDQRRAHRDDVAGGADQNTLVIRPQECLKPALGRLAWNTFQFYRADQAHVADVDDMRQAAQRMQRVLPVGLQFVRTLEQTLLLVRLQRRDAAGGGDRVAGIGIAVEELDHMLGAGHERVMQSGGGQHRAHRDHTVGQALGAGDHVGQHVEMLSGEWAAKAAEASDHFVKDQQDAVFLSDRPQLFQIPLGRQQHAG